MTEVILERFLVAAGIGLLVGFQRESAGKPVAGFRTFTLISVAGFLCGMLRQPGADWLPAAGLAVTAGLILAAFRARGLDEEQDPGLTSQVAAVSVFLLGLAAAAGHIKVAVVVGGSITLLLHAKPWMHALARRFEPNEIRAIMQFILVGFIILPLMPDRSFGPYQALNPYGTWKLIVLMVAISLAGYLAHKAMGDRAGTVAIGLLGGAISSTATTLTFARKAAESPRAVNAAAVVIGISSAVVYARVLAEIAVVHRAGLGAMAPPLLAVMLAVAVGSLAAYAAFMRSKSELPPEPNPAGLKSAVRFGLLFALVTVAVAAANHHYGTRGLYAVAALSGLTDMDAITLSTAALVRDGGLAASTGWRMILLASMSNMLFKSVMVALLGGRGIALRAGGILLGGCAAGVAVLVFWPG